jgi:HKD family nuclease
MKVSFLDGPSLAKKLHDLFSSWSQLDVAMAYVKIGGLRTLLKNTDALIKRNAPIRIVFGLSSKQGITDKKSVQELLNLSHQKNVAVKKWNNCGFHPKLFIFHGNHPSIVVGSSNLTEAAQSTNAEANVLIEDADSQLMQEATAFFERYFNAAPILKRQHVNTYKPKPYGGGAGGRDTFKEDKLPLPSGNRIGLETIKPKTLWKIAPGKDANCWDEWLNLIDEDGEGIVAMGWDEVGDLRNFTSADSLKQEVLRIAENVWNPVSERKTDVNYVTDQLWAFKTAFASNDIIIVYSESRVLGIAEVTSKSTYRYKETKGVSYAHQMNVRYWWYKDWPKRAEDRIVMTLGKQGTLRRIKENWIGLIYLRHFPKLRYICGIKIQKNWCARAFTHR